MCSCLKSPMTTRASKRVFQWLRFEEQFIGVVEEQRHCQHEIHDHPGRQQTAATLGPAGVGQHLVDQIAVHQPGQHTKADPISQPVFAATFTTGNPIGHKR